MNEAREPHRRTGVQQLAEAVNAIHALAEDGHPIMCPDPGTEHGRALLRTLGVQIVFACKDPEAAWIADLASQERST